MEYLPYQLTQKSALNRMDLSSLREGILLRKNGGYGCIHPWPELGDPSLSECLADLRNGAENRLVHRALASTDLINAEYLKTRTDHPIEILSHATIPRMTGTEVTQAARAGFTAVKVKRGKDWMRMRKKTADMMEAFPQLRWRFDFNGALETPLQLRQFLGSIPAERVDFIEDPFSSPEVAQRWRGVFIGYDRVLPEGLNLENGLLIAKPAIQSREEIRELAGEFPERVIFTSYMDHPVGQVSAYLEAEKYYTDNGVEKPPLCGLVTHGLYEETPYARLLGEAKPQLQVPSFQEWKTVLDAEGWKSLDT